MPSGTTRWNLAHTLVRTYPAGNGRMWQLPTACSLRTIPMAAVPAMHRSCAGPVGRRRVGVNVEPVAAQEPDKREPGLACHLHGQ